MWWTAVIILPVFILPASAQPLFTYGNRLVDKKEFITAFNRSPDTVADRKKALQQYLRLYINYKLKVQAAYDEKLNESSSFQLEAANFKRQLAENIINEEANEKALIEEAFERSKKDILVQQVFVEYGKDTLAALKKITTAYQQLKEGKNFDQVATAYAKDEVARDNKGYMGYITVFTLPYEFENIIYRLSPGNFSVPCKSQSGYHIFRCVRVRPAVGRRKITQILLTFPPNATVFDKQNLASLADDLYNRIKNGQSFDQLAEKYSSENFSAGNNGMVTEISVGQYSSDFENEVFSLQKENDITRPFVTTYGYHIVQLKQIVSTGKNREDPAIAGWLKQQTENGDRLAYARQRLVKKWLRMTHFQEAVYDKQELWRYMDSARNNRPFSSFRKIKKNTVLFSFSSQKKVTGGPGIYGKDKKMSAGDFVKYIQDSNFSSKNYPGLLQEFIHWSCGDYYRTHLEEYSPVMRQQVKEFTEANLLFTVMDKHIWTKAGDDTAGLRKYYTENVSKYIWQPGVAAIIIAAGSPEIAEALAAGIRKNPENWRNLCNSYGSTVTADSGRYENNQLPQLQKLKVVKGAVSTPEKTTGDESYRFIYITEVFYIPGQRSLEEAKGLVTNDYQQVLEEKWIAELRKKYPVKMKEKL
jgi:peptidyl-prolyl cis-trans isomerase SurA